MTLALLLTMSLGAAPALDPVAIQHDVKARGAKAVVSSLWQRDEQWGQVVAGIGTGEPAWLQVAVALQPGSDAGASESLEYGVSMALAHNPQGALDLVGRGFKLGDICKSPLLEATPEEEKAFLDRTLKALAQVKGRHSALVRKCIKRLKK